MKLTNSIQVLWRSLSFIFLQSIFSYLRVVLLILSYLVLTTQLTPLHGQTTELRTFIKSSSNLSDSQEKLDSFLLVHKGAPQDSLADCFHDIGYRWYYKKWQRTGNELFLNKAIEYTSKAVKIKNNKSPLDSLSLQKSLSNLGYFQLRGSPTLSALATYKDIIKLNIKNKKTYSAYRQVSECYNDLGDYHKALDIMKQGIELNAKDTMAYDKLALAHYQMASAYAKISHKDYSDEILDHLKTAFTLAENSKMSARDKAKLSNIANHLYGNHLIEIEDFDKAIEYLEQNIQNFSPADSSRLAIAHNSLGIAHFKQGDIADAYDHFKTSISYDKMYTAPYENLGDYFLLNNQYEKGLHYYQKAITTNVDLHLDLDFNLLPDFEDLRLSLKKRNVLSHLIQKAIAWKKYYDISENKAHLTNSLSTFQMADQLIDEIRFQNTEEQSKLYWQNIGHDLYVNAVDLCYQLDKSELAYHFMEKNKALLLLGNASTRKTYELSGLPKALVKKEFDLKRNIYILENEYAHSDNLSADSIRNKIYITKNRLESFLDSVYAVYPEYAKAQHQINILPYDKFIHEYTSSNEAVIHYILGDSIGYGLLSVDSQSILFSLGHTVDLKSIFHNHLTSLRSPFFDKEQLEQFQTSSNELFEVLFPSSIVKAIAGKNLTIISDQIIQQLPFESLVCSTNQKSYLIEEAAINYQYSISYHAMNNEITRKPKNDFLGMAPLNFSAQNLPSLPHSEEEITEINALCDGELYVGDLSTKRAFLSKLDDTKIIHLSTHASSGDSNAPWIAFEKEKIFFDELNGTRNQAELVVLSACNTAIGEYKKGEGAMSLARSFFYSGSNAVLSSLWSTNDKSSKELMIEFYRQLKSGRTKSDALREAKILYLQNNKGSALSPYYWASTIVIGNNENISIDSNNSIYLIAILGIFAIVFGFWYSKYRKQNLAFSKNDG